VISGRRYRVDRNGERGVRRFGLGRTRAEVEITREEVPRKSFTEDFHRVAFLVAVDQRRVRLALFGTAEEKAAVLPDVVSHLHHDPQASSFMDGLVADMPTFERLAVERTTIRLRGNSLTTM
jgi:hypothetical protein